MERIYIGVAWPYANGPLHFGHLAGSLLPPDIFARYHRMKGDEVLMVSGSDMHGTPITVTAEKEGSTPEAVAERFHRINSEVLRRLGISFDLFTSTHTENHRRVVQELFGLMHTHHDLYEEEMEAPYCPKCVRFLPDRFVEGTCPHCGFADARGDQCDECGKTYDATELKEPRCRFCRTTPERRKTTHFFFKLSHYQLDLLQYANAHAPTESSAIDENWKTWKPNTWRTTNRWLREGLKDRAITRDIAWGIPLPVPGYESKRIYVWFEAVTGYLSASIEWAAKKGDPDGWKPFWLDPATRSYYFMGKDNIPFHTIIWPAMLLSDGRYKLPDVVVANEFLRLSGDKLSKSRTKTKSIYLPDYLAEHDPDPLRYYLSVHMPEAHDTDFTWEEFAAKNNDELLAAFGNLVNRVLTFTRRNFSSVPPALEPDERDGALLRRGEELLGTVGEHIGNCRFADGIRAVMDAAREGNRYFDEKAPWALVKTDRARCGHVLNTCIRFLRVLAVASAPYLPFSAARLWRMCGGPGEVEKQGWDLFRREPPAGFAIESPAPLFRKVELKEEKGAAAGGEEGLRGADLRVARILSAAPHPSADKLYVLSVNIGKEERQLVAGIRPYYSVSDLTGKTIVVITNLERAVLRGVESQGMLLALDDGNGTVVLMVPGGGAEPGEAVTPEGLASVPSEKTLSLTEFKTVEMRLGEVAGDGFTAGGERFARGEGTQARPTGTTLTLLLDRRAGTARPLLTAGGLALVPDRPVASGARVK